MNYELAKQLKDAGFPQTWNDGKSFFLQDGKKMEPIRRSNEVLSNFTSGYSKPTLEELIEACGENFKCLTYLPDMNRWDADTHPGILAGAAIGFSSTKPDTAVALLWIALKVRQ